MEAIVAQIHKLLTRKKKTIAIAESCTSGLLSSYLTHLSGSSKYFILGIIAYHNMVKIKLLKVPGRIISQKGAVSEEVALRMAQGVRKLAKTDLGIGITGIAGPAGATLLKPVGTVFVAAISKNKCICRKLHLVGSRTTIRKKAALKALELLRILI